jgi:hypothetical protein
MANDLFSEDLTQRHKGTEKDRNFPSSFVPLCLCVKNFGLIVALLFLPVFLQAQDGGTRFIQRLTWTGDEYARRYEVVIEREERGEYRELLREFTTALFIEVSLLPGKYRCCVITHDFLNLVGEASEWRYLEVLARLPEQDDSLPDFSLSDTESPVDETDDDGPGQFKVNLFLNAAWMPSFPIYGEEDRFFGRNHSFSGVAARFGAVWAKADYYNPGLELLVSYNFFDASQVHLLAFGLNLSALKPLPGEKTALTFRLGAGYSVLSPEDGAAHVNMGVSFLLFVTDNWYLETGLDYAHWFTTPPSGCLRPWLGFRKWLVVRD